MCFRRKKVQIETLQHPNVKLLDYLDDVWVKEGDTIYKGWVFDKTRRHITILYDNGVRDFKFRTEHLKELDKIEQDNKILYTYDPAV